MLWLECRGGTPARIMPQNCRSLDDATTTKILGRKCSQSDAYAATLLAWPRPSDLPQDVCGKAPGHVEFEPNCLDRQIAQSADIGRHILYIYIYKASKVFPILEELVHANLIYIIFVFPLQACCCLLRDFGNSQRPQACQENDVTVGNANARRCFPCDN